MRLLKRGEIIEKLTRGRRGYDGYPLAWNVKCYHFDSSGYVESYTPDPAYDDQWGLYISDEASGDMFGTACSWWWERWQQDSAFPKADWFENHPDLDVATASYEMTGGGRSGGWMMLHTFGGFRFTNMYHPTPLYEEMDYATLWRLYKFVLAVDEVVNNIPQYLAYFFAEEREQMDYYWQLEDAEETAASEEHFGEFAPVIMTS